MVSARGRTGRAWALSLAVHAAVVALLLRLSEHGPRPPPTDPISSPPSVEIEIAERPTTAVEGDGARRAEAPRGERVRARDHRTPPPAPVRLAAPAPTPPPSDSGSRSSPRPLAPAPDLSLRALPADVQARVAGTPAGGDDALARPPRPGRRDVDELRADIERADDAVANVREGRADPLLYDYLRGASARFESEAQRLADNLPVDLGSAAQGWGRGYLGRVAQANRGELGARGDAAREGGGDRGNELSPHADVLGAYDEARRQAEGGAEERRAEVCLDVAPGRETATILRRGSGSAALDRLAVDSFAKFAAARPVPPDAPRGLACYELRITAYRVPPLPVFSCAFDAKGPTCIWPFKKIASVKSRLMSVEYPPRPGARDEPPSLLRRAR